MRYAKALQEFERVCGNRQLSDDYLRDQKCETRKIVPVAIEFSYGVVYLRDDAVDALLARIKELEARCKK